MLKICRFLPAEERERERVSERVRESEQDVNNSHFHKLTSQYKLVGQLATCDRHDQMVIVVLTFQSYNFRGRIHNGGVSCDRTTDWAGRVS